VRRMLVLGNLLDKSCLAGLTGSMHENDRTVGKRCKDDGRAISPERGRNLTTKW